MGIKVLPPDINRSQLKFAPDCASGQESKAIRFGLAAVKNVGTAAMETAISERASDGGFKDAEDFAKRLDSKTVNKKNLESLVRAGAFDSSGEERARLFSRLENIMAAASSAQKDRLAGQVSLFGEDADFGAAPEPSLSSGDLPFVPWSKDEILSAERELLGFYVTGHPLDAYRPVIASGKYRRLSDLQELKESRKYDFAGRISAVDKRFTKKAGKPFAILSFEEFTGQTEVMVWSEVFEKSTDLLEVGKVIVLTAKVELDSMSDSKRLTAERMRILAKPPAGEEPASHTGHGEGLPELNGSSAGLPALILSLRSGEHTADDLCKIRLIVTKHGGETPLHLRVTGSNGKGVHLVAAEKFKVKDSELLRRQLSSWIYS